jgi:hypothetical protein
VHAAARLGLDREVALGVMRRIAEDRDAPPDLRGAAFGFDWSVTPHTEQPLHPPSPSLCLPRMCLPRCLPSLRVRPPRLRPPRLCVPSRRLPGLCLPSWRLSRLCLVSRGLSSRR